ncbi:DNA-processing protein DprA [Amnibacterium endophyticum]|uniref:DNA-processing protein DprA n=1 Tax=Amnibacterium endophyticum TaxID=2109337 RepID=A0ABW4LEX4_9MICO
MTAVDAVGTRDLAALVGPVRHGRGGTPEEAFARGAWTAIVEPGDAVASALIATLGAADALEALLLDAPPVRDRRLVDAFTRWRPRAQPALLREAFAAAARVHARLVLPGDEDWPAGLDDLAEHAPLALWARTGCERVPDLRRSIALVGTRDATSYGRRVTEELGSGLVGRGFAIVSGGAAGIDRGAHQAAIRAGGTTAAIMAGGVDRLYPQGNRDLLERIAVEGVVLSELACGSTPMRQRFLSRNRLIAASSRVTTVVEAGVPSGAINTAAHAGELGRPIAVVPGSIHSSASKGCHKLLREYAAVLVQTAADVAELARDRDTAVPLDGIDLELDPLERQVLDALGRSPLAVPEIARRCGIPRVDAAAVLAVLGLDGAAVEGPRGWVRG